MLLSLLKKLKLKLQFTGWLQYIPPAFLGCMSLLIAAISSIWGFSNVTLVFVIMGALLLATVVFDIITLKYNLRPHEPLPKRKDKMGVFDLMKERHSCRSFQPRKLTSSDYKELMECVQRYSASPKTGVTGKSTIRFEYIAAPLTVWPVVGAQEFLVAIAPKEYCRQNIIDVGRNLQKIVLHATRMGLGTCWIGPGADHTSIVQHLGDRFNPTEDHIICVCAIGYESWLKPFLLRIAQVTHYRRLPLSSLFFSDNLLREPLNVDIKPFSRFGRTYEACQWAPSSFNAQPTRCAAVVKKNRLVRFDFYTTTTSRYYAAVALGIWCANWETGCNSLGIEGHFAVLPEKERHALGENARSELPRYDVSWVLEEI